MIDPTVSLAFSIHSTPGAYALLLGSGVSRAAAVPTGWEIVLDLIRKVAMVQGAECARSPETWYATQFGEEPDYSRLIERVSASPTERRQLLRAYFEPTPDELREGKKTPTAAHKAIARMMAEGSIRLVITTNFDRLLEMALSELGVHATVVAGVDALKGMLPLAHAEPLIVKVNGDYLDTRLRNTTKELGEYDPAMCTFLDRVFDEFGLIVCGWSAEWDTALCHCIERCNSYRFTTYWTTRSTLTGKAQAVATLRRADIIPIQDADSFFTHIADKLVALEDVEARHPLSAKIAVAQAKRYLGDTNALIKLHDLIERETSHVHSALASARVSLDIAYSGTEYERRVAEYERCLHVLGPVVGCTAQWGNASHGLAVRHSFERIANGTLTQPRGTVLDELRLYPATLLLYAVGIVAVAAERQTNLAPLLALSVRDWHSHKGVPACVALIPSAVLRGGQSRLLVPPTAKAEWCTMRSARCSTKSCRTTVLILRRSTGLSTFSRSAPLRRTKTART